MTTTTIKAISLHQPWASLIPMRLKKYETRSWATNYRGPLLICAAKKTSAQQQQIYANIFYKYQIQLAETDNWLEWDDLPKGCAVVLVDLTDCIRMTPTFIDQQPQTELDTGDWTVGRFAWKFKKIRRIMPPIQIIGRQGLFNALVELPEEKLEANA
ncbi:ASCH domain-containing protein [aff. Roholtiella sp. LEGE 12411]|uniref:ASCH domain-containing protein n=1 Tax=aff. Roholtiella sp. LEGE 12411 TaxID=1828822 RepID=UPI001880A28A|nr:ASCH domain-containing protein [aff. Roholtiella sp. LEGE 12411]MBE9036019.1 ASCH domain-containing protein [aff. Roholtiella sp. LEGE 12411]